jgi:2-amino-4-hydroxy-6-hydroxymethyldihydropteridine diphosphokinase
VILIALGANLPSPAGKPADTLEAALAAFALRSITIEKRSGFYRSAAWPDPNDPPFINAVAAVRTNLSPAALLATLHAVESSLGRERAEPNAPRTLDLDILLWGDREIHEPGLDVPHPRLAELHRRWPGMRIVAMSVQVSLRAAAIAAGAAAFIPKGGQPEAIGDALVSLGRVAGV